MGTRHKSQPVLTRGMLIRMLADTGLVAASLAVAVGVRLLYLIAFEAPDDDAGTFVRRDSLNYLIICPWIVAFCLAAFYSSGFYTYGKHYLSKYKVLVVAQAVSVSYILVGFLAYFMNDGLPIARAAWLGGWLLTMAALIGSRIWSDVWKRHVAPERESLIRRKDGKRVLVIGGGGYIGSALLPRLLSDGYSVRLLDVLLFGEEPIAEILDHEKLEVIRGDFRNVGTVMEAMKDCDAVVHLGGIVGDPACNLDESRTIDINLVSTKMIAERARDAGIERFIFASTCSVYGACDELLDERSRLEPVSLYGHTKQASEDVLRKMATDGFSPTILRFATIYGFSGRTRFDLVINVMTAKAKLEGEIQVHGGDQWRPFVHVDDAAKAVHLCLESPMESVANQVFNVGSDEQNHTISQIAEMISERVLNTIIKTEAGNIDPRNYRVSFKKIRRRLGYQPGWSISDGIQQVLEAIATGKVTDYSEPKYSNVKFLSESGSEQLEKDKWARQMIDELTRQ